MTVPTAQSCNLVFWISKAVSRNRAFLESWRAATCSPLVGCSLRKYSNNPHSPYCLAPYKGLQACPCHIGLPSTVKYLQHCRGEPRHGWQMASHVTCGYHGNPAASKIHDPLRDWNKPKCSSWNLTCASWCPHDLLQEKGRYYTLKFEWALECCSNPFPLPFPSWGPLNWWGHRSTPASLLGLSPTFISRVSMEWWQGRGREQFIMKAGNPF